VDESRLCALPSRALFRQTAVAFILLLVLTVNGCSAPEAPPPPSWSATEFSDLVKAVAELRGLLPRRSIVLDNRTAAQNEPIVTDALRREHFAAPVAHIEYAYKSVGLLPADTDLARALEEYRRIAEIVHYDAIKGSLHFSRDAARLGASFEPTDSRMAREAPAVLAIVKALQEQHFRWTAKVDNTLFTDSRMALHAIAGGDAVLALLARAPGRERQQFLPAAVASGRRIATEIDKLGASLPEYLRHQLSFPYREGVSFVAWAAAAKNWEGVNALYADPPLTSAQILHPEKYFSERETSLRFFPAGLMRDLGGHPLIEESVGEYLISDLLRTVLGAKSAADAAAGWRGDQLFFFQASGNPVTAWFSDWVSDRHARQFYDAYQTVLERRQRVRFEGTETTVTARTRDRGALLLQLRGSLVLVLYVEASNALANLQEKAWKDLEVDSAPPSMQFESARFANQLSRAKR
jgi:hypothetical protein